MLALYLLAAIDCSQKGTYLFLPGNSFAGIECLKQVESVSAEDRAIVDLTPLAALKKLKKLAMAKNKVRDLTPLSKLTDLQELDLSENEIVSLEPLRALTKLTKLRLMRNQIADVSPLKDLVALEELYIYDNRITDVSALVGLKKLTSFNFERNAITNLGLIRGASPNSHQYSGSCAALLRGGKFEPSAYAVCPPWEDDVTRALFPRIESHCRAERICGDVMGVDCHSAADGGYDYVDLLTSKTIAQCGGHCMERKCTDCPPARFKCLKNNSARP